jgi:hypothetical protein
MKTIIEWSLTLCLGVAVTGCVSAAGPEPQPGEPTEQRDEATNAPCICAEGEKCRALDDDRGVDSASCEGAVLSSSLALEAAGDNPPPGL